MPGVQCAKNCDLMVLGDQFTEMYYPKDLIRLIDKRYSAAKEISAVNIPKFFKEIYQKKTKIKFTVTKNKTIGEEVRKYILTFFKNKKKQGNRG